FGHQRAERVVRVFVAVPLGGESVSNQEKEHGRGLVGDGFVRTGASRSAGPRRSGAPGSYTGAAPLGDSPRGAHPRAPRVAALAPSLDYVAGVRFTNLDAELPMAIIWMDG